MNEHRQRIEANHVLDRILAGFLGFFELFLFHLATGVGDVDGAVDHGRDAGAGAAAGYGDRDFGFDRLIFFGPGLGHVDQGVGTLVLD